ncbi:cyclic AMP-responsive element-binding protein 3-like protein 4 [Emydura macquarii macquarii]|uniref:cyclic AMP-responsive element-binding protein 3-like protein 4 n=1 Tax=Emydura macquarii macquarii TaxID=1129001 RepID=UPI00352B1A52
MPAVPGTGSSAGANGAGRVPGAAQRRLMDSPELLDVLFEREEPLPCSVFPSPDHPFAGSAWAGSGGSGLNDGDPDDFLKLLINPNEVFSAGSPRASPASDSGISEAPCSESPQPGEGAPTAFREGPCAAGALGSEPLHSKVVSIQLGERDWPPPFLVPDACIMNELPAVPPAAAARPGSVPMAGGTGAMQTAVVLLQFPDLFLTEEEKRLLSQEGVSLPSNLPLTKAEERLLKKVRRKIRNKQSAQDSRRRKKEYIDGLESRVAACSTQNQELQKKVQELEKDNVSLLGQLRKLQALIKQTSNKAAQTSTCILILILSLGLIIFPTYSPLRRGVRGSQGGYQPSRVISRNILNQGELSEPAEAPGTVEPPAPEPEQSPGEQPRPDVAVQDGAEAADGGPTPLGSGSRKMGTNTSALAQGQGPGASRDGVRPLHADEM